MKGTDDIRSRGQTPSSHNNMPVSEEEIDVQATGHQPGQSSSNENQELRVQ